MSINGGSVTTSFITADGATLNLLSGTLTSNFNTEYIGNTGSATVIQSGGTHNSTSPIYLGNNTGSSGTYSLSAGTLSAPAVNEYIGNFGTGSFIQSDGTHTVSNLYIGIRTHSAGTLHLSGGTVSASTVLLGSDSFNTGGAGTLLITGGLFSCRGGRWKPRRCRREMESAAEVGADADIEVADGVGPRSAGYDCRCRAPMYSLTAGAERAGRGKA